MRIRRQTLYMFYKLLVILASSVVVVHLLYNQRREQDDGLTFQCSVGQLGNTMFYYAVTYGVSKLNDRKGFIQKCNTITCHSYTKPCSLPTIYDTFHLSLPIEENLLEDDQRQHAIGFHLNFPNDYRIPKDVNVLTGEFWPVSVTFFRHVRDEIKKEFTFKRHYIEHAKNFLRELQAEDKVLVSVHVRRGDYIKHLETYKSKKVHEKFFKYAMNMLRVMYQNVNFVVLSDDLRWCREHIVGEDVYIPDQMYSQEEDLAVLSQCNHSIFDYGTYGFWGAFLAGGTTVYYIDGIIDGKYNESIRGQLMYPPEWIGVSNAMLDAFY